MIDLDRFDRATGYSYGYGFVDYYRTDDAAKGKWRCFIGSFYERSFYSAIEALNQTKMEHKTIKVSYARPKCEETRGTNLYIRNLPGKQLPMPALPIQMCDIRAI
jgi:hypothetical protein